MPNKQINLFDDTALLLGQSGNFIDVAASGGNTISLQLPSFEIDGKETSPEEFICKGVVYEKQLDNGGIEIAILYSMNMDKEKSLDLMTKLQYFPDSPVLRYKYVLASEKPAKLTKQGGKDNMLYSHIITDVSPLNFAEVQLGQFDVIVHSFIPFFEEKNMDELRDGLSLTGPLVLFEDGRGSYLTAYEHGAQNPDAYLKFDIKLENSGLSLDLKSAKGNYYAGQAIGGGNSFESPWFQFAACRDGLKELLKHYRRFLLHYICEQAESRKPYVFYNTWNNQERDRNFKNLPYLYSMNSEHILKEIDVAHEMGVDIFVIDTGWFSKTGDWEVNEDKFPDGMKAIRKKLDSYRMKLGLWFNPIVAAVTSRIYEDHPEYAISLNGEHNYWGKIWETEESYGMCLVSNYSSYFVEKMVELNKKLGVTYFKWDAISQYGCNSPSHHHGNEGNSPEERLECYSYSMGLAMIKIVEEVTRSCPEIIVDFDITEGGRFVGLGFLSVGKYFLMNNGPYAMDMDIPERVKLFEYPEPIRMEGYTNMYAHPGAARSRICRQGVRFDNIIPSILFLTHFFPDKPHASQENALASMVLGGNGIWGDLINLDENDVAFFSTNLAKYKEVAGYITESYPVKAGFIGASPEIYEKIDYRNAKGLVCIFTRTGGTFVYITKKLNVSSFHDVNGADAWVILPDGRISLTVILPHNGARTIFIT